MSTPKRTKSKPARKKSSRRGWRTAKGADRHELYERSVQDTGFEVEFLDKVWRKHRGRLATTLREDFCGTAKACVEWVRRRPDNRAIGVDLDPKVLAWGEARHRAHLPAGIRRRIDVRQADVLSVRTPPVETLVAMMIDMFGPENA